MDRTIVHFEIPANDPVKLSDFYAKLFGWKFEKATIEGAGDYWMITTKAKEEAPGINGGMMKKVDANQRPINYVLVESVEDFSKKAQQLGANIIVTKTAIPKIGSFAIALDPEGTFLGSSRASNR